MPPGVGYNNKKNDKSDNGKSVDSYPQGRTGGKVLKTSRKGVGMGGIGAPGPGLVKSRGSMPEDPECYKGKSGK